LNPEPAAYDSSAHYGYGQPLQIAALDNCCKNSITLYG